MVQWVRLHAPNAGGPGSIPGQGTRSHTHAATKHATTKILRAATKTWCSQNKQINKYLKKYIYWKQSILCSLSPSRNIHGAWLCPSRQQGQGTAKPGSCPLRQRSPPNGWPRSRHPGGVRVARQGRAFLAEGPTAPVKQGHRWFRGSWRSGREGEGGERDQGHAGLCRLLTASSGAFPCASSRPGRVPCGVLFPPNTKHCSLYTVVSLQKDFLPW